MKICKKTEPKDALIRVKKFRHILSNYKKLKKKEKNFIKNNMPLDFVKLICEILENVISGRFPVKKSVLEAFQKFKNKIKTLLNNKILLRRKKEVVMQGGNLLATVLGLGADIVAELLK